VFSFVHKTNRVKPNDYMRSIENINNKTYVILELDLKSVSNENKFFNLMNETFEFPNYFRNSFDSLDDCMRDLGWVFDDNVIIRIKNILKVKGKNAVLYTSIEESLLLYKKYWDNSKDKNILIEFM
jgi:RNAse (barnase) inhibitor barstar